MRKRWVWLLVVAVVVGGVVVMRSLKANGGPLYIEADLKDAPFAEALRQLFSGPMQGYADYVVESGRRDEVGKVARMVAKERLVEVDDWYVGDEWQPESPSPDWAAG